MNERTCALRDIALKPGRVLTVAAIILGSVGCGGEAEGGPGTSQGREGLPPAAREMSSEVQDLVNQGNTAQREGRYQEALAFYQQAMEGDLEHPVPQFGALMASMALGDSALARTLREKLQVSSPELVAMLSSDGGMGGQMADPHDAGEAMPQATPGDAATGQGELPPGHPVLVEVRADTIRPDTAG
ncbi:hypothetical protein ACFL3S_00525 [Gemmatimonadota bacterium]